MVAIEAFTQDLQAYLNDDQINKIRRAYYYAEQAHDGQMRKSGEPYVTHPLAVARILSAMQMDHQSLMAALLHDCLLYTSPSPRDQRGSRMPSSA